MENWYVIYTKPHKEPLVNRQLEDRGLEVFFPTLQFNRGYNRGIRLEPFFPHYLFAKVDLMSDLSSDLRWLAGVRTLVHVESRPIIVPNAVIDLLRQRLQPYEDKVLRRSEWLFKPGQRVIVTKGPFTGFEAIFQKDLNGTERAQILLKLLGAWNRAEIDSRDLKPA
jgi:transcriptional antiterminator RfaH